LGCTIFELLTDELPYGEHGGMIVVNNNNIEPAELPQNYSLNLRLLIAACLEKESWNRPTSEELLASAKSFIKTSQWILPARMQASKPPVNTSEQINKPELVTPVKSQATKERKTEFKIDTHPNPPTTPIKPKNENKVTNKPNKNKILFYIIGAFAVIGITLFIIFYNDNSNQESIDKSENESGLTINTINPPPDEALDSTTNIPAQCYKSNLDVGMRQYNSGKYQTALTTFQKSLKCPDAKGGN
jgi:hypothetical protein